MSHLLLKMAHLLILTRVRDIITLTPLVTCERHSDTLLKTVSYLMEKIITGFIQCFIQTI